MIITFNGVSYQCFYVENIAPLKGRIQQLKSQGYITSSLKYDTESTGLHIKKDMPFIGAIAFRTVPGNVREAYAFPTTPENLRELLPLSELVDWLYCHNTVFDMHMTANGAGEDLVYSITNWGDTQGLLRMTFEAVSPRDGGDKLALKEVSKKYVDKTADRYEKAVKGWLKSKESANRKILGALFRGIKYTLKEFDAAMKTGPEALPEEARQTYFDWRESYPEPTYADVPMEIMLPYVCSDVVLTDLIEEMSVPVVMRKEQWPVVLREFKNLRSTFKMTRRGFKIDRPYLQECRVKLEDYVAKLTKEMHELAGQEFTVGQHAVIKEIYTKRLGKRPASTDAQFLKKMIDQGDRLALLIKKLRTLEKWLSTYLIHMLEASEYDGRLYAGLNQFGTVSGRHSGDFQQMPKDPLLTLEGDAIKKETGDYPEEAVLFQPRRAVITEPGSKLFFMDFSQEELRFQANFTLPMGGDLNLCRAYMPFRCVHYETGEIYDFRDPVGRERWMELREGAPDDHWEEVLKAGWSVWIMPETREYWVPTDVHGATAKQAMKAMGLDIENKKLFKFWRNIGKRYNFMKTYGGGPAKSAEVLEITLEQCQAIDNGFVTSFPVIVDYQDSIIRTFWKRGYITNLYGRRYYLSDSGKFYKGANYMIQGSCADDLKEKILKIDAFLDKHGCRSQILMPIHDELCYEIYDDELWIVPHLVEFMRDTPKLLIPMVVEPSYADETWAKKKPYELEEKNNEGNQVQVTA